MGYVSKSLGKMLFVFEGLAASLSNPSQAIDSKDEVNCFIHAPIQGQVAKMSVDIGQEVKKGDRLCTVSTMKMEFDILARFSGKIHSTLFKGGDYVEEGSLLVVLLPPEAIPQLSNPSSFHTPPSNQGKEGKALSISQDANAQQAPMPSNAFSPSLLWFSAESPDSFSEPPASIALDLPPPASFAFPVAPGATTPPPASPPDIDSKPGTVGTLNIRKKGTGRALKPPAQPAHPQETAAPSDKAAKPFLKKGGEKETAHSMNGFPNMFLQELPKEFLKPAIFDGTRHSVVACAKWMVGLMVLAHILFTLKTMASPLLLNPLSRIRWLRAADFCNQRLSEIPQMLHNRNRIERGCARKRKIA